jgi:hypothetical protein
MESVWNIVLIVGGIYLIIAAQKQEKRDGHLTNRSNNYVIIGITFIVVPILGNLPAFIRLLIDLFHHN